MEHQATTFSLCPSLRAFSILGVFEDPVEVHFDPGVEPRLVPPGAAPAPADHADDEDGGLLLAHPAPEGAPAVPRAGVLTTVGRGLLASQVVRVAI